MARSVHFFESSCCSSGALRSLTKLLGEHFGDEISIRSFNLQNSEEAVPLPPSLLLKLDMGDIGCLPAMAVDSTVVAEGWVPEFDDAVQLVKTSRPLGEVRRNAAPAAAHSCCGGGQCACG